MVNPNRQSPVAQQNPYTSPNSITGDSKHRTRKLGRNAALAIGVQVSYYVFAWLFFMADQVFVQILLNGFFLSVPILCTGSDHFPAFLGRSWLRRLGASVLLMILSVQIVLFTCGWLNLDSTRVLRQLTNVSYGLRFLAIMTVYFCSLFGLAAANRNLLQS